jgi:hypothetical protein
MLIASGVQFVPNHACACYFAGDEDSHTFQFQVSFFCELDTTGPAIP